ncbi:hypothetical protein IAD21_05430 [Abditibacteriota bacterium]|nr:hypothetical protein IAD21_05430 [Abditibacteriota bacterium]
MGLVSLSHKFNLCHAKTGLKKIEVAPKMIDKRPKMFDFRG